MEDSIIYKLTIITECAPEHTITVTVTEATKDAIFKGCEANAEKGIFIDADGDSFLLDFTKIIFIGTERSNNKKTSKDISQILDNLFKDIIRKRNFNKDYDDEEDD